MRASMPAPTGRESEVRACVAALEPDPASPRMVLLRGEAGIGKSTVFDAVVRLTSPALVFRAAEAERALPYAALADLLADPLAVARPSMPRGHAEALGAALGIGEPGLAEPDPRAVALATTEVLTAMLGDQPVILAIDDVQWLDHETEMCLAFAVRRLVDRGLGVLLAMRSGPASGIPLGLANQAELAVIDLGPLPVGDLGAAIAEHLHRALPRPTLVRVQEMSRGNPLLALELARHLPDDAAPDELPTAPDVERLIGRRVRDLRRDTIDLLILAAACGRPTVDLLAAATGLSALDCASRLGPDASDGLVDVDGGVVRFVHPLFVSAVLNAVSPGARVDAHRRLADLTFGAERALHLAAAASGPDEEVASIIEAEADGLARRGAPASAASLMERAAALSPDPNSMGRRRLQAASLHTLAGDGGRGRRLSALAVEELPAGPTRARARARLFTAATTADELEVALDDAGEDDGALAIVHWTYAEAAFLQLDLPASIAAAQTAVEHAERAGDTPTMVAAMVHLGFARNLLTPGGGLEVLHAAAALPFAPESPYDSPAAKIALNQTAMDDFDGARTALEGLVRTCRTMGADGSLAALCIHLVELEVRGGDLRAAHEWLRTAAEIAAGDGDWQTTHIQDYLEALVLGREGDGEGAVTYSLRGLIEAVATGDGAFVSVLEHTAAVGLLQCGRPAEALGHLTRARQSCEAVGLAEPGVIRFHGPEIEALIGVGDLETARTRIAELDALGQHLARPRLVGEATFGRGLLLEAEQDHAEAMEALTQAVDIFDAAGLPWERERARLELGVAMRRARQRRDARDTLDAAEAAFATMGADGWAARAAQERERISGRAASSGELTPIETQVADLVASGLPNKQVAAQLFLSPKTVESHLSHIYAKTGVRSRTELAALLMRNPRRPSP